MWIKRALMQQKNHTQGKYTHGDNPVKPPKYSLFQPANSRCPDDPITQ